MKIRIESIKKANRYREEMGDIESLALSIGRVGLIHPIVLDENNNLIAGERRLSACQKLGWKEIEAKKLADLSEIDKKEIELDENLKRKDLSWTETTIATKLLFDIKQELYGKAIRGHGGGYGQKELAESQGVSVGTVSQSLQLAEAIEKHPELKEFDSQKMAWKRFQRMREQAARDELAKRVADSIDKSCLALGDSREVIKTWEDKSIAFMILDPPYGIDLDRATPQLYEGYEKFEDSEETAFNILGELLPAIYKVLADNAHLWIFFAIHYATRLKKLVKENGFDYNPIPAIWNKGSAGGSLGDYSLATAYEPILFCMKGKRRLNKVLPNVFSIGRVSPSKKIHPTEKPVELLTKMIELSSDPGDIGADLFAGSGSFIEACYDTDRVPKCVELNKSFYHEAVLRIGKLKKDVKKDEQGTIV